MENQLKCVLLLSLKDMALRRVVVLLFSDSDILASVSKFQIFGPFFFERKKEWRETIEHKIKDKILKVGLPESFTKEMIDIVRPIGLEVFAWKRSQEYFFRGSNNEIGLPGSAKLCWTTSGTINYGRTAEKLVRCEKLDVKQRYELACFYCLENYISLYWEELPEETKRMYGNDEDPLPYLPYCWPYILKGQQSELDYLARESDRNLTSFNQFAFEDSAKGCRKTAAEYFFHKLTPEERECSLMRTFHALRNNRKIVGFSHEKDLNVLFYLLSLMTPEQQVEAIKPNPVDVFSCFLHWPRQDLFLENKGVLWSFLRPVFYTVLLSEIHCRYQSSDFYFPIMFKEFFSESPQDFKKCFVDRSSEWDDTDGYIFLSAFFAHEDPESIKAMFRNMDAADRVKLLFHRSVLQLFYGCMLFGDKWHLVEVCLREAALAKEEKGRLKDAFTESSLGMALRRQQFKRFYQFLDETGASSDKRENSRKRNLENCSPEQ